MATILVVQGDPAIRFLLRFLLEHAGHIVLEAPHGAAALDWVQHADPDLVVTDTMGSVMSGWQLIERLRADPETTRIPILAISSIPRRRDSDVDAFLTKPFDPDDLLKAADALIDLQHPRSKGDR